MKFVHKVVIFTISLYVLILFQSNPSWAYDLQIQRMDVNMVVSNDNSYLINENLAVQFLNVNMHGIFRNIPLKTYFGKPVEIDEISVPDFSFTRSKEGDNLQLKIGDPNKTVGNLMQYEINYRYTIGDDRNDASDELYFNLIGSGWEIPIQKTYFKIEMPKPFDEKELYFSYGQTGSTEHSEINYVVEGNTITGSLDWVLNPGETLTIALYLPDGYFDAVKKEVYLYESILKFLPFILPSLFILGVFILYKFGRDEHIYPVISFYPPEGLTPAEIGYIYDELIDPYDLTSMLIYWADKGYIKIIEEEEEVGLIFKKTKSKIKLEKLQDINDEIQPFESIYFGELFDDYGYNGIVQMDDLENQFYITLNKVRKSLIKSFKKDESRRIFARQSEIARIGIIIIGIVILSLGVMASLNYYFPYDKGASMIFGLFGGVFIGLMFTFAAETFSKINTRLPIERIKYLLRGVFLTSFAFIFAAGMNLFAGAPKILWLPVILSMVLFYLSPIARQRTAKCNAWMSQILGFKDFLENAERNRINTLVEEDPEYFYHLLPYAMVLGVTDKWAKQFENITLDSPSWYDNQQSMHRINAVYFASHLSENTKSIGYSMVSSPSSSGGSSGGGSGGGGGGGW